MRTCRLCVETAGPPAGSLVRCAGEIDLGNTEELRAALIRAGGDGVREIAVDLLQITFLDSSAIKTLLQVQRELTHRGVRLRVLAGGRPAALLRLLGLERVLQLTEAGPQAQIPHRDPAATRSTGSHSAVDSSPADYPGERAPGRHIRSSGLH